MEGLASLHKSISLAEYKLNQKGKRDKTLKQSSETTYKIIPWPKILLLPLTQ